MRADDDANEETLGEPALMIQRQLFGQSRKLFQPGRHLVRRFWPKSTWGRVAILAALTWATLVSIPVLLVCLMMGIFLVNDLAGALFGAVNLFNSPFVPPPAAEMLGTYTLAAKSAAYIQALSTVHPKPSRIILRADGSAELQNVYEYVEPFEAGRNSPPCSLSGSAKWVSTQSGGVVLQVRLDPSAVISGPVICSTVVWTDYAILARHAPHRLWSYIVDPDSNTGLEYKGEAR